MNFSEMSDQEKLEYSRSFRRSAVDACGKIGRLIHALDPNSGPDYGGHPDAIKSLLQAQTHLLEQVRLTDLYIAELEQKPTRYLHIVE